MKNLNRKNNKVGRMGGCLPDPQLDNYIYYSKKLSKI